jgi:hypothetical protein
MLFKIESGQRENSGDAGTASAGYHGADEELVYGERAGAFCTQLE